MPGSAVTSTRTTWTFELQGGRRLELGGGPRVAGVVNVTPDSFSDGGRWLEPERAVEHALELAAGGAAVLDLGAESTRPGGGVYGSGAAAVSAAEEIDRLLPVLEALRGATDLPLSVDTRKGEVARAALAAGADLINDVSALGDPATVAAVAEAGCPVVLMHSRGDLSSMQRGIRFDDLLGEVRSELAAALERAVAGGVDRERTIVDPGIGFGKRPEHNRAILARLDALRALGRPIMVGASRKSFLAEHHPVPPTERLPGSLAAAAWAARHGAELVRAHDVEETAAFLATWAAIAEAAGGRDATEATA